MTIENVLTIAALLALAIILYRNREPSDLPTGSYDDIKPPKLPFPFRYLRR